MVLLKIPFSIKAGIMPTVGISGIPKKIKNTAEMTGSIAEFLIVN